MRVGSIMSSATLIESTILLNDRHPILSIFLLLVHFRNQKHHGQINFILMIFFQNSLHCNISTLASSIVEVVRGPKSFSQHKLWYLKSMFSLWHSTISQILEQDQRSWFLVMLIIMIKIVRHFESKGRKRCHYRPSWLKGTEGRKERRTNSNLQLQIYVHM